MCVGYVVGVLGGREGLSADGCGYYDFKVLWFSK